MRSERDGSVRRDVGSILGWVDPDDARTCGREDGGFEGEETACGVEGFETVDTFGAVDAAGLLKSADHDLGGSLGGGGDGTTAAGKAVTTGARSGVDPASSLDGGFCSETSSVVVAMGAVSSCDCLPACSDTDVLDD